VRRIAAEQATKQAEVLATVSPASRELHDARAPSSPIGERLGALPEAEAESEGETVPPEPTLIKIQTLPRDSFRVIHGEVEGCSESCACRLIVAGWNGDPVPVCTCPAKYDALVEARDAAIVAERTAANAATWARMEAALADLGELGPRETASIVAIALRGQTPRAIQAAAEEEGLADRIGKKEAVVLADRWAGEQQLEILGAIPAAAQLRMAFRVPFVSEKLVVDGNPHASLKTAEWYLGPELEITPDQVEAAVEADLADEAVAARCARCGTEIEDAADPADVVGDDVSFKGPDGVLYTRRGLTYCAGCAPDVRVCRGCGCTDLAACATEDGLARCWWVERDLCSWCMDAEGI